MLKNSGFISKGQGVYPYDGRTLLQHHQRQRPCACECAKLLKNSISYLEKEAPTPV